MRKRAPAALALLAVLCLGFAAIVAAGAARDATPGLDLGVPADYPVARLTEDQELCQGPIGLDDPVSRLEFTPAPGGNRGPALELTMRDYDSRRTLSSARVPPEVMTGGPRLTRLRPTVGGRTVDVCIRHAGGAPVEIYGDVASGGIRDVAALGRHPTLASSDARLDGRKLRADAFLRFPGPQRSVLAQAPTMIERMSRFRAGWFGPWLPWLLLGLLGLAAPAALYRAAVLADDQDHPVDPGPRRSTPAA